MFTIGVSPLAHASYSGPVASAPAATRARTIASWLPRTARPSGVAPSCSAQSGHTIPSLREEQLSTSSILNMCPIVHTRQQARYVAHLCSHTHPPHEAHAPNRTRRGMFGFTPGTAIKSFTIAPSPREHASSSGVVPSCETLAPSSHHITTQHTCTPIMHSTITSPCTPHPSASMLPTHTSSTTATPTHPCTTPPTPPCTPYTALHTRHTQHTTAPTPRRRSFARPTA